jgi:hypothetical protein
MNQPSRFTAAFVVTLSLGTLLYSHQTTQLNDLQRRTKAQVIAARDSAPSLPETTMPESSMAAPGKPNPAAEDPAAVFMSMLMEKVVTFMKPDDLAEVLGDGGYFENILSAVKLTDEERASIQQRLKQFNLKKTALFVNANLTPAARAAELAAAKQQREEWLVAKLGKERADAAILSIQLHERASAEKRASEAVLRMDYSLNLSDAQKNQLLAGLIKRDLTPATAEAMLNQETYGGINIEPPVPDLSADMEKILPPAQWQLYQKNRQTVPNPMFQEQKLMDPLIESAQSTLVEFLQR